MKRRSRTTRSLKWVGLVGSALLAGLWVTTLYHTVSYRSSKIVASRNQVTSLRFSHGAIAIYTIRDARLPGRWWYHSRSSPLLTDMTSIWPEVYSSTKGFALRLPLFFLLVLAALPTAWLWYRDRRPPKWHCESCGYNLTGNVSGVCPECGNRI
jgi:hypothetical protein